MFLIKKEILECIPNKLWESVSLIVLRPRKTTLEIQDELNDFNVTFNTHIYYPGHSYCLY